MVFNQQSSLFVDWNSWGGNTKLLPVWYTHIHTAQPALRKAGPRFWAQTWLVLRRWAQLPSPRQGSLWLRKAIVGTSWAHAGHVAVWSMSSWSSWSSSLCDAVSRIKCKSSPRTEHEPYVCTIKPAINENLKCKVGIQYWSKYSSMSCTNPAFFNHHPQQRDDLYKFRLLLNQYM